MPGQLLALVAIYGVGGLGCAAWAFIRLDRRNLFEGLVIVLIWPLYAPFLLGPSDGSTRAGAGERQDLEQQCHHWQSRLLEMDALLASAEWDAKKVRGELETCKPHRRKGLLLRLEHIERLMIVRKVTSDELEALRSLLEQLEAQTELSRFIDPETAGAGLRLDEIRERLARSEARLASDAEYLTL